MIDTFVAAAYTLPLSDVTNREFALALSVYAVVSVEVDGALWHCPPRAKAIDFIYSRSDISRVQVTGSAMILSTEHWGTLSRSSLY